jgi:hypothetical protein
LANFSRLFLAARILIKGKFNMDYLDFIASGSSGAWMYDIKTGSIVFDKVGAMILGFTDEERSTGIDEIMSLCDAKKRSKIVEYFNAPDVVLDLVVRLRDSSNFEADVAFFEKRHLGGGKVTGKIKLTKL